MDVRKLEQMIDSLMKHDLSEGTESFRESLLERCLAVLGDTGEGSGAVLSDEDLEMLAAAGEISASGGRIPPLHPHAWEQDSD